MDLDGPRGLGQFRRLWLALGISEVGTGVSLVAIPLTATALAASPFEFSWLAVARYLPWVLVALPAGVLVDRVRRQGVLVRADLVRAIVFALIPIAFLLNVLSMPLLIAAVLIAGVGNVFFDVGYLAFLPTVVSRSGLVAANARLEATASAAGVIGPGLGGLLAAWLWAPIAVAVDAASYLASAAAIRTIRVTETPERSARPASEQIRTGLAAVWRDPSLRATVGAGTTVNFTRWIWSSVIVLYAVSELGLSAADVGLVFATGGVAAVVGARLSGPVARRIGVKGALIIGMAGIAGFALLLPLATPATALWVLALAYAGMEGFALIWDVNAISLRQEIAGPVLAGRINATARFLMFGVGPAAGAILGGVLGSVVGLHWAIAIGALAGLASIPWVVTMSAPVVGQDVPPAEA